MKLEIINVIFIFSLISIWILLLINILLALNGYIYYLKVLKSDINLIEDSNCPTVSIMIPAHNEEKVIYNTDTFFIVIKLS